MQHADVCARSHVWASYWFGWILDMTVGALLCALPLRSKQNTINTTLRQLLSWLCWKKPNPYHTAIYICIDSTLADASFETSARFLCFSWINKSKILDIFNSLCVLYVVVILAFVFISLIVVPRSLFVYLRLHLCVVELFRNSNTIVDCSRKFDCL